MNTNPFNQAVLCSLRRVALPIATYPGLALTGGTVRDVVTRPEMQYEIQAALQQRYGLRFVLSAMDLSAEAEAFGCHLHLVENEIPCVVGRLVTTREEISRLRVPRAGEVRTAVYLETVRRLRALPGNPIVLGGCIGPFSLAARLVGMSEALELTLSDPDLVRAALEKSAAFLREYVTAFKTAGAHGVIMAEPAAGLLSPRGMAEFSCSWVKQIAHGVADGEFALILHNCAARLAHVPAILQTGLTTFHFGTPMDMRAALDKVPATTVLCGNLDPAGVFCRSKPEEVRAQTVELLTRTAGIRNYVLSSGCDIPPGTPLANLDAFYSAI